MRIAQRDSLSRRRAQADIARRRAIATAFTAPPTLNFAPQANAAFMARQRSLQGSSSTSMVRRGSTTSMVRKGSQQAHPMSRVGSNQSQAPPPAGAFTFDAQPLPVFDNRRITFNANTSTTSLRSTTGSMRSDIYERMRALGVAGASHCVANV